MAWSPDKFRGMPRLADANGSFKTLAIGAAPTVLGPVARKRRAAFAHLARRVSRKVQIATPASLPWHRKSVARI